MPGITTIKNGVNKSTVLYHQDDIVFAVDIWYCVLYTILMQIA